MKETAAEAPAKVAETDKPAPPLAAAGETKASLAEMETEAGTVMTPALAGVLKKPSRTKALVSKIKLVVRVQIARALVRILT